MHSFRVAARQTNPPGRQPPREDSPRPLLSVITGSFSSTALSPPPHIFDYSARANRTASYLINQPNLAALSLADVAEFATETAKARTISSSTAESADLIRAGRSFAAAQEPVDRVFPHESASVALFLHSWIDLMKTGQRVSQFSKQVDDQLSAEIDLAKAVEHAFQTGDPTKSNVMLAVVKIKTAQVTAAVAGLHGFDNQKREFCGSIQHQPQLRRFVAGASQVDPSADAFCREDGRTDLGL